ncbi:MAG: hypothetical protein M5U07_00395 [Xanthobacteraceae bacterium]|nr:hypothetical protein [Xanthobacteraceae bacterium]
MHSIAALPLLFLTSLVTPALAQVIVHGQAACDPAAVRGRDAGFYLLGRDGQPMPIRTSGMPYTPSARFMFVAGRELASSGRSRVLVIKARTVAAGADTATRVELRRALVDSRCGRFTPFAEPNRFVHLNDYIDHHTPGRRSNRTTHIGDHFHFKTTDMEVGDGECVATHDVQAADRIFNIDDTHRSPVVAERTPLIRPAAAGAGRRVTPYAGLRSEMQVVVNGSSRCVVFDAPLPSYEGPWWADFYIAGGRPGWARNIEALRWKPSETTIEVLGLGGSRLGYATVRWKSAP